jgi:exonuclease-1
VLRKIPTYLAMPGLRITNDFIETFMRAERTFLHQIVYDPIQRCRRPLTPYNKDEDNDKMCVCV